MNPDLIKALARKTKEPAFAILLAGGVWLGSRVDLAVAEVDAKLARIEARMDSIERALEKTFATNP